MQQTDFSKESLTLFTAVKIYSSQNSNDKIDEQILVVSSILSANSVVSNLKR